MRSAKSPRQRALVTLLHNVHNRRALANRYFGTAGLTREPERRAMLASQLPTIVADLIDELAAESNQQRRKFTVLRRSDIAREDHRVVARDIGLSRSQFYRDLHEARETLAEALEQRLGVGNGDARLHARNGDTRFVAIEALRNAGRHDRAREVASGIAREGDAVEAIHALCLRAELEAELGAFADARRTATEARELIARVPDERQQTLLRANCALLEAEAAHGQGQPPDAKGRRELIDGLRRSSRRGDRQNATLLAKALVAETSLCFEQGDAARALACAEEALGLLAHEPVDDLRVEVDAKVRASGVHALRADRVTSALNESVDIIHMGKRSGDIRTLRVGMQMTSAHLLTLGRVEEARRYALDAKALIDLFGSTLDQAIVLSNLARIDVLRGEGREALRWVRIAKGLPCNAFTIAHALAITEAEALVLLQQAPRALHGIRALSVRVGQWPRLVGRAKLAEAITLHALGRKSAARDCSDQAVEASHADGTPLLQLRSLDLHAKLTGSERSRRDLRELQAALSA